MVRRRRHLSRRLQLGPEYRLPRNKLPGQPRRRKPQIQVYFPSPYKKPPLIKIFFTKHEDRHVHTRMWFGQFDDVLGPWRIHVPSACTQQGTSSSTSSKNDPVRRSSFSVNNSHTLIRFGTLVAQHDSPMRTVWYFTSILSYLFWGMHQLT